MVLSASTTSSKLTTGKRPRPHSLSSTSFRSRRFCYLAVIFDLTEVSADARAYGTTAELRHIVEVRKKWDTLVTVTTHHGNGTSHIVLDDGGMTLRQVLEDIDGDIEMGHLCERAGQGGRECAVKRRPPHLP